MRKLLKGASVALVMAVAGTANAEMVSTDWLASGDGLATLDTQTGIEWMDLTQTKGMTVNQILNDSRFDGWRLPTASEVESLLKSYLPDVDHHYTLTYYQLGAWPHYENKSEISQIRNMLDFFVGSGSDYQTIYGMYSPEENQVRLTGGTLYGSKNQHARFYGMDNGGGGSWDYYNSAYAPYLVSDGGVTLSSINDPNLNKENPNAPINASAPLVGSFGLMCLLTAMGTQRRRKGQL